GYVRCRVVGGHDLRHRAVCVSFQIARCRAQGDVVARGVVHATDVLLERQERPWVRLDEVRVAYVDLRFAKAPKHVAVVSSHVDVGNGSTVEEALTVRDELRQAFGAGERALGSTGPVASLMHFHRDTPTLCPGATSSASSS